MKPIVYERLCAMHSEVLERISNVKAGIDAMARQNPNGWTWDLVLSAILQTDHELKKLRARVRVHRTKERRSKCEHPMTSRTAWGVCHKCGQTQLEPRKQEVAP